MPLYSVLLLTPDYAAETYGQETFFTHVEADRALDAVIAAQAEAVDQNVSDGSESDWYPLLVLPGWHNDLSGEVR